MVNGYVLNKKQPSIECLYEIAQILNISIKELLVENE
jgi:putative transcriptional regulator